MKIAFCAREERYAKEAQKYFRQKQGGAVSVDYYENAAQLLKAQRNYEWILMVTDHETRKELNEIFTLQDYQIDSTVILFSADAGKKVWYWSGVYTGAFNGQPVIVAFQDIYLFESYRRVAYLHTRNEKIRVTASLREEEKKLPSSHFIQVNQGCIVNMQYIKEVDGSDIHMDNGDCCYISSRRKTDFMKKYQSYHSKYCIFGNL